MSQVSAGLRALSLGVVLLLFASFAVQAQTGLYGEIAGTVVDSSGAALPGVTVTVTSSAQMGARTAVTEADGTYRLPALTAATDYRLTYELPGFATFIREGIVVSLRSTTTLNINLQIANLQETVTVTGESPVVDVTTARQGLSLTPELLQSVPTGRDFYTLMNMNPGTARNTPNVGGSAGDLSTVVVVGGTNDRQMHINGAESFVPSGDGRYGNFDAYDEVVVETGGAGADIRRAGGGFSGEMVAKTGGNQFHGQMNAFWYNDSFTSNNLNDKLRANNITRSADTKSFRDVTGQIGGPFIQNRMWWFASLREYDVFRYIIGRDGTQEGLLRPLVSNVTYQLSQNNRLQAFYSKDVKLNPQRSMDRFTTYDASYNQQSWAELKQLKFLRVLSSRSVLDTQVFMFKWWWPSFTQTTSAAPFSDSTTGLRWNGGASNQQERNYRRYQWSGSITNNLGEWRGVSHDVKVGGDIYGQRFRDYLSIGRGPDSQVRYQFRNPNPDIWCDQPGATCTPSFVTLYNGPVDLTRSGDNTSIYGMDRVSFGRFTLNVGARWDRYHGSIPAQASLSGTRWEALFPAEQFPAKDVVTYSDVMPRLSAAYRLTDDGRTVLKASYGTYTSELDPIADTDIVNGNQLRSNRYAWRGDLNGNNLLDLNELGNLASQVRPRNNSIAEGLQNPTVKELGFTFERELPMNVGFRAQYYYSRHTDQVVDTNVAKPLEAYTPVPYLDPGPDGLTATGDDRNITVYNLDPAYVSGATFVRTNYPGAPKTAHSLTFLFQKRMSNNWQMIASYGFNRVPERRIVDFNDPNAQINDVGRSQYDVPHSFKLVGSFLFPYGVQVSSQWQAQSGFPYDRVLSVNGMNQGQFNIIADPRGTYRYDKQSLVDLRFEKQFPMGGTKLGLMLEGFNMLNSSASTDLDGAGIGTITGGNFGQISKVTPPRTWRLGARYNF